LNKIL